VDIFILKLTGYCVNPPIILPCKNWSNNGPPTTIAITGKIKKTKGIRILMGAFKANLSPL
jgi:hypothetical protein